MEVEEAEEVFITLKSPFCCEINRDPCSQLITDHFGVDANKLMNDRKRLEQDVKVVVVDIGRRISTEHLIHLKMFYEHF